MQRIAIAVVLGLALMASPSLAAKKGKAHGYKAPAAEKSCGTYMYHSKGKCVDARNTPPGSKSSAPTMACKSLGRC